MASPQKENGYIPVARELLQAVIKARLSPSENAAWSCVADFTYGWGKKWEGIEGQDFVNWTGYSRGHIRRAVDRLVARRLIKRDTSTRPVRYSIQKDYDLWLSSEELDAHDDEQLTTLLNAPTGEHLRCTTDGPISAHDDEHPKTASLSSKARSSELSKDNSRETWLTPFLDLAWELHKLKLTPGKLARPLKPVYDEYGKDESVARWARYLRQIKDPQFVSGYRFAELVGTLTPEVQQRVNVDKKLDRAKPPLIAPRDGEMKKLDVKVTGDFLEDFRDRSSGATECADKLLRQQGGAA